MKLLLLCAVFSVCVVISLGSPAKTTIHDEIYTSSSEEEKEQIKVQELKVKDSNEDNSFSSSSEEETDKTAVLRDGAIDDSNVEEEVFNDKKISKRNVISVPHNSNQVITANGRILNKLKRLRRDLRITKNAYTSKENSSEEDKKGKNHVGAPLEVEPDTDLSRQKYMLLDIRRKRNTNSSEEDSSEDDKRKKRETETNPEVFRLRRTTEVSSEEDQMTEEKDVNEVFIFSNEKQLNSEENFNSEHLKANTLKHKNVQKFDIFLENKNSEEDYAKGCGGNRDDDSNESSNEHNETLNDKL